MTSKKNTRDYPIHIIREDLRQSSARQAALLSRSVGRLTSYDARPCTEYGQEVTAQYAVIDELLYLQQCRSALERCIASGAARLRYRWRDGHMTETRFRKTSPRTGPGQRTAARDGPGKSRLTKLYDTDTAKYIGDYEYGNPGDFEHVSETLYQKKTGEFFLHGEGGPKSKYAESCGLNSWCGGEAVIPEHDFDVKEWVATYCDVDTYIELFGAVEE